MTGILIFSFINSQIKRRCSADSLRERDCSNNTDGFLFLSLGRSSISSRVVKIKLSLSDFLRLKAKCPMELKNGNTFFLFPFNQSSWLTINGVFLKYPVSIRILVLRIKSGL